MANENTLPSQKFNAPPAWAITILIAIAMQTISGAIWGGAINERVTSQDRRLTITEAQLQERIRTEAELARLNANVTNNTNALLRIEAQLSSPYHRPGENP